MPTSKMIPLSQIIPNAKNPRKWSRKQLEGLKKSLAEFQKMIAVRPMVVDEDWNLLGGNFKYTALRELGYDEIPEEWVDQVIGWTDEEKAEFIIKDNGPPEISGEWDWGILSEDWNVDQLAEWGLEIPGWANPTETTDDGYVVKKEIETNIQLGDLIEIGPHRLLCGDSTNPEDVAKLLNGQKPFLMVTDPPYGVNYDPEWRNITEGRGFGAPIRSTGKVQNDDNADWSETWKISPCEVAYVWHAGKYGRIVQESLERAGYEVRSQIIWAKPSLTFSRGNYHWQHEPCFYAVRKGSKANWIGGRKQSTLWEIAGINPAGRSQDKSDEATGHGTQKPVECMARPVRNHDGSVYDPFLGSGTSLIACQQLGRVLFGMDIDPKYCQVTIDRALTFDPTLVVRINGEIYTPVE